MVPHSRFRGLGRLVEMAAGQGWPTGAWVHGADGVVEDEDSVASWNMVEQNSLDLRVVVAFDTIVAGEVSFLAVMDVFEHLEGVLVKAEVDFAAADVLQCDGECHVAKVAFGYASGWHFDIIERESAVFRGAIVVYSRGHGSSGDGIWRAGLIHDNDSWRI
jgi:hypothetical protein